MKRIVWTEAARADVRNLSKPIAMQILSALHRFAESGTGAVVSPGEYFAIEFFVDGHIEVQTYGPANLVQTVTLQEIIEHMIREVNG